MDKSFHGFSERLTVTNSLFNNFDGHLAKMVASVSKNN